MKVFIISIVMWWANPAEIPYPYNDAVEIKTYMDKPLQFTSLEKCFEWVGNDLENIKAFGHAYYPTATAVREIICIEKKGT